MIGGIYDKNKIYVKWEVFSDEICYIVTSENEKKDVYLLYSYRDDSEKSYAYKYPEKMKVTRFSMVVNLPFFLFSYK